MSLKVEDWGLIDYESAVSRQLALVESVSEGDEERLVICTHPPVVTLGRATVLAEDMTGWTGATVETSRGGRATYHGPNQLVLYPILDLRREREGLRPRDIHAYLRSLETVTVSALQALGLSRAESRTTVVGGISLTGVWVGEKKIASLGIAVRKWVTYHGVAVNVLEDPTAFHGIRPCGFAADVMTSLEASLSQRVDYKIVKDLFAVKFCAAFSAPGRWAEQVSQSL